MGVTAAAFLMLAVAASGGPPAAYSPRPDVCYTYSTECPSHNGCVCGFPPGWAVVGSQK